jgi:hypothetical protein
MTDYGGFGGITGGRALDLADAFERLSIASWARADEQMARDMWSALANIEWKHDSGDAAGYTFRAAGDLVAAIRGSGDYMDWYCSGPDAHITDDIAQAMKAAGWTYEPL